MLQSIPKIPVLLHPMSNDVLSKTMGDHWGGAHEALRQYAHQTLENDYKLSISWMSRLFLQEAERHIQSSVQLYALPEDEKRSYKDGSKAPEHIQMMVWSLDPQLLTALQMWGGLSVRPKVVVRKLNDTNELSGLLQHALTDIVVDASNAVKAQSNQMYIGVMCIHPVKKEGVWERFMKENGHTPESTAQIIPFQMMGYRKNLKAHQSINTVQEQKIGMDESVVQWRVEHLNQKVIMILQRFENFLGSSHAQIEKMYLEHQSSVGTSPYNMNQSSPAPRL